MKNMFLSIIITSSLLLSGLNALFSQDFDGYTVGLNVGNPIFALDWLKEGTGPSIGIAVGTPYEFDLGSYAVGVGGGIPKK